MVRCPVVIVDLPDRNATCLPMAASSVAACRLHVGCVVCGCMLAAECVQNAQTFLFRGAHVHLECFLDVMERTPGQTQAARQLAKLDKCSTLPTAPSPCSPTPSLHLSILIKSILIKLSLDQMHGYVRGTKRDTYHTSCPHSVSLGAPLDPSKIVKLGTVLSRFEFNKLPNPKYRCVQSLYHMGTGAKIWCRST